MRRIEKVLDGVNSCFPEQLILDPVRQDTILDLAWSGAQDMVQESLAGELTGSECITIRLNNTAGKGRPHKSSMLRFDFKRARR